MKTKLKLMIAGMVLSAGMAMAAVTTEQVISDLQAEGYTWIEVKRGPTQIKVEAVKGTTKIETIIDTATGAVLKTESETASAAEQSRVGVQVRDRNRDFLEVGSGDDASSDDDSSDDGSDDDSSDDDSNDDGDDNGNDDGDDDNSGHGSDDDGNDDHGGGDDSDNGDDDNSGHGGDDGDDDNGGSNDD